MLDATDSYLSNHAPGREADRVWKVGAFTIVFQRPHKDPNTHRVHAALDNMAYVLDRATGGQLSPMNSRLAGKLAMSHAHSFRLNYSRAVLGHPDEPMGFTFTLTPKPLVIA